MASTVSFRSWSFAVSSSTLLRFKSTSVFSRVPPRSSKSAPHTPTRAAPSRMKISIEREIASTKLMNELSLALPKYVALSGILSAAELAALAPRKTRTSPSSNHASLGVTSRIVVALFVFFVASYAMGASICSIFPFSITRTPAPTYDCPLVRVSNALSNHSNARAAFVVESSSWA